jgi:hypothetical protein
VEDVWFVCEDVGLVGEDGAGIWDEGYIIMDKGIGSRKRAQRALACARRQALCMS